MAGTATAADVAALVYASTDPWDKALVIRRVTPNVVTFSAPFVRPLYHLPAEIPRRLRRRDGLKAEPRSTPAWRTYDCDTPCIWPDLRVCFYAAHTGYKGRVGQYGRESRVDRRAQRGAQPFSGELAQGIPRGEVCLPLLSIHLKSSALLGSSGAESSEFNASRINYGSHGQVWWCPTNQSAHSVSSQKYVSLC